MHLVLKTNIYFCCLNTSAPAALTSDTSSSRLLLQVTVGYFCTDAGFRTRPRFCCWFLLQINVAAAALRSSPARFPRLLGPHLQLKVFSTPAGWREESSWKLSASLSLVEPWTERLLEFVFSSHHVFSSALPTCTQWRKDFMISCYFWIQSRSCCWMVEQ